MCRILKNLWPSFFKMSSAEWAFFTPEQNECGELEDPKNGKLACKLKQGTAYCRVKCYKGFMYENTKERSQWCKNGRWMPRRTPRCVPDPFMKRTATKNPAVAGGSYAYGRSQRKKLNKWTRSCPLTKSAEVKSLLTFKIPFNGNWNISGEFSCSSQFCISTKNIFIF